MQKIPRRRTEVNLAEPICECIVKSVEEVGWRLRCINPSMMKTKRMRQYIKSLVCDVFVIVLQLGSVTPSQAGPFHQLLESVDGQRDVEISNKDILKSSQISYRADGGFSGLESYGVILSCVNGHISVMKSIYDPRLSKESSRTREIGNMDEKEYLALWDNMDRHAIFKMQDAPQPKQDISDEFTIHFYAKVGENYHKFDVYGISRPEAARYFAVRKLIDDSVGMQALWNSYHQSARQLENVTASAEKAN